MLPHQHHCASLTGLPELGACSSIWAFAQQACVDFDAVAEIREERATNDRSLHPSAIGSPAPQRRSHWLLFAGSLSFAERGR